MAAGGSRRGGRSAATASSACRTLRSARHDVPMSYVRVEQPRPGVAVVTLDRPERMNAMAFDVMVPLRESLQAVSHDNDVRVVVLTGAGTAFCSGADLEDPGRVPGIDGLTLPTIA